MAEELVSIVIPTYNRKDTLQRCIDSILNQTYRNFEIIIVDDCSTDGTFEFIDSCYGAMEDINIIYVRNDSNVGPSASRNAGVSYANGDYIAFQDSDDEWMPDKLEKQMNVFRNADSRVGAVYCLFERTGQGTVCWPPSDIPMECKSGYVFPTILIMPLVGMITLVVRKSVLLETGGFNEQLISLEDYELTIRIAEKYELILVDEILASAHEAENSLVKRENDKIATQFYIMSQYRDTLKKLGIKKEKFDRVYYEASVYGKLSLFLQYAKDLLDDEDYILYIREVIDKERKNKERT